MLRSRNAVGKLKGMVHPIPQRSLCYITSGGNITLEKSKTVATVMQKPSKPMDIDPIIMIFAIYGSLTHTILHAKNEGSLPCGFRDSPIATAMATRFRLRLWRFYDVIWDVLACT